jgi:hypothetical protein
MIWARMLAYITGTVDQELLLRNEYLAAENRILRAQSKGRLLLSDAEKATLAEIAHRLGRKALEELAAVAKPDTLLAWYRKLNATKFDGSKFRKSRGRPRVDEETEQLVVRMAKENPGWGYDRIVGSMANLGLRLSDQTVGNILRRHDIPPAPKRKQATSWKDFIRAHMAVLVATDFFTVEVLTLRGLLTYYVLFFIHLESRRICLAGVTRRPDQEWMEQMARNVTMEDAGFLIPYGQKTHLRFQGRGVSPTEGSCRFPLIVLEQTTQPFLATHYSVIPARPSIRQGEEEPVLLALVIALLEFLVYGSGDLRKHASPNHSRASLKLIVEPGLYMLLSFQKASCARKL